MDEETERIKKEIFGGAKEVVQEQSNTPSGEINPELLKLFPPERIKRIMEKEARKYKHALRKKWSRWMESMSK